MIKATGTMALILFMSVAAQARADAFEVTGDDPCSAGYTVVSVAEARAQADEICAQLGTWDIVRLAGGGSMDGPGYDCKIRKHDERQLGNTLCRNSDERGPDGALCDFDNAKGDVPCPAGARYLTAAEARDARSELCSELGEWDIVRLADGGSMDGPGYGCKVREQDDRKLGNTLCTWD